MPVFAYRALGLKGEPLSGELEAATIDAAQTALRDRSLSPYNIKCRSAAVDVNHSRLGNQLPAEKFANLVADLAALTKSGVPLRTAFEIIGEESTDKKIRALSTDAVEALSEGRALESVFSGGQTKYLTGLISAGRASGALGAALEMGARGLERELSYRRDIVGALSYPAFVFAALLVAMFIILLVVAPSLAPLVAETSPNQAPFLFGLVLVSDILLSNSVILLIALTVLVTSIAVAWLSGNLRRPLHYLLARYAPGRVVSDMEFGAWAIATGFLTDAGVSAPIAAAQATAFVRNEDIRQRLAAVADLVLDGRSLSAALRSIPGAPPTIASLAALGERSGALPAMLTRAGEQCYNRALSRIRAFAAIATPAALLVLGAIVGSIASGLLTSVSAIGEDALR